MNSVRWTQARRAPALSSSMLGVAIAGFLIFVLIALLVQVRALAGIDLAVTRAKQPLNNPFLDAVGEVIAILVSAEFSVIYAGVATFLLWRAGAGRWSLAPFAFLLLEPVELLLKTIVHQPPVPNEFYRGVYYPLTTIVLSGSFPSGHAMRTSFFCAFVVILLHARGGKLVQIGTVVCVLVALLAGASRVYLGYHWLSDVVAGLILGAALATLVAVPLVEKRSVSSRLSSGVRPSAPNTQHPTPNTRIR